MRQPTIHYGEPTARGTPTKHQIARIGGGHLYHALPVGTDAGLCGIKAGGGRKTRGKWWAIKEEAKHRYGVTCQKCQALEPSPASEATLSEVLERCVDPADDKPAA